MSIIFPHRDAPVEPLMAFDEKDFKDALPIIVGGLRRDLAISIASINDRREASWYGPWLLALQIMFLPLKSQTISCITCPQYPVIHGYDPASPKPKIEKLRYPDENDGPFSDEEEDEKEEGAEDDDDGQTGEGVQYVGTPSMGLRISLAPSPTERSYEEKAMDPTPLSTPNPKSFKYRSLRVPDFSQMILKYQFVENQASPSPPKVENSKLIMIVEVKAPIEGNFDLNLLYRAQIQVEEQARHAFSQHSQMRTVGCIISFGPLWTFYEIAREHLSPLSVQRVQKDQDYKDEDSSSDSSESTIPDDIEFRSIALQPGESFVVLEAIVDAYKSRVRNM